jgi:holo-[acyl-carrier protein] synthase
MATGGFQAVGIDIVAVDRIQGMLERWGRRFLDRVYTEREIEYCLRRAFPAMSLAARFAAKEAFFKAVSRRSREPIPFKDVEVVTDGAGAPELEIRGAARKALGELDASVSLAHERKMAIAVVMTSPGVKT